MQGNITGNGLSFYSHETNRDNRTSLNLTPEKPFRFSEGFTLSFDFCLHTGVSAYGYILRMIGDNNINFDLLSSIPQTNDHHEFDREFLLVVKNQTVIHFAHHDSLNIKPDKWVHIVLEFNHVNDQITVDINGLKQTASYDFEKNGNYRFFFGSNNFKEFVTSDVPPMEIKDIRLFNYRKNPVYYWKMDKHVSNTVYDEYKQARATVVNPIWKIDAYTKWKRIRSFRFSDYSLSLPQIAWDKYGKRFFFADSDHIYAYYIESDSLDMIIPLSGMPYHVEINQLFYNHKRDELVFYEFEEDTLSLFSFQTKQWSRYNEINYLSNFMQHSSFYDENSETIYTMGGYGYYRYSSILQMYKGKYHQWIKQDLSGKIHPRYLASMGIYKDSLFLYFGGYGNESGRQQESPHNYYDLYSINRNNMNVSEIWELEKPGIDFLNSNSLICNEKDDLFYVLSYPNNMYETYAILHEYNIGKPSYRVLGDSIPYYFNDIESFCNLYKPEDERSLYALMSYVKDGEKEISIYSIAYPPLSYTDTLQDVEKKRSGLWGIVIVASLLVLGLFYFIHSRSKRKNREYIPEGNLHPIPEKKQDIEEKTDEKIVQERANIPAINMLGELSILNSDNENLAQQFTPTTKQLFLLLLLRTINKKGITSQEIQNTLWPHKDNESARNNRNVYFNKLRLLFNNLEEVKIQNEKGLWIMTFDNNIYIDYEEVKTSIRKMNTYTSVDKSKLSILLEKILKGKFLPFYEFEWLDEYKTEYTDTVIDFLYTISGRPEVKNDDSLLSVIADAILVQDNIDEKGVKIKCNALVKLGKQNQAVQVFRKYCEDYKKLLGEKPKTSMDEFIDL